MEVMNSRNKVVGVNYEFYLFEIETYLLTILTYLLTILTYLLTIQ